jgi:hypothetical protein
MAKLLACASPLALWQEPSIDSACAKALPHPDEKRERTARLLQKLASIRAVEVLSLSSPKREERVGERRFSISGRRVKTSRGLPHLC